MPISNTVMRALAGSALAGNAGRSLLQRFKVRIHEVDSTVMELVANCMNWTKHLGRKAAAKLHMRLGLNAFLPTFAIVDTAGKPRRLAGAEIDCRWQPAGRCSREAAAEST